jgi:hypothetical protein
MNTPGRIPTGCMHGLSGVIIIAIPVLGIVEVVKLLGASSNPSSPRMENGS